MKANAIEMMRRSLDWARECQQDWRSAYARSVAAGLSPSADHAAKQVAVFDEIIQRYEDWIKEHGDQSE